MPRNGDPRHFEPVFDVGPPPRLVRRRARDDEPDSVKPARFPARLSEDQMTQVDRVERAAVDAQSHSRDSPLSRKSRLENVWTSV